MRVRLAIWGAVGLLAATAAAGCSGGGGDARLNYVRRVNQLCNDQRAKLLNTAPSARLQTPQALADALRKKAPIDEEFERKVAAIEPPAAERAVVRQLLTMLNAQRQDALAIAAAITRDDVDQFNGLYDQWDQRGKDIVRLENRLGLNACAQPT